MNIPVLRPIYNRERANNMYRTSSYFLTIWLSTFACFIFYPLITSVLSFSYLGFQDNSLSNYLTWLSTLFV